MILRHFTFGLMTILRQVSR